jgi:hypothetical protein
VPEPRKTPLTSDNNTVLTGNPPSLIYRSTIDDKCFTLRESSQLFKSASVNNLPAAQEKAITGL